MVETRREVRTKDIRAEAMECLIMMLTSLVRGNIPEHAYTESNMWTGVVLESQAGRWPNDIVFQKSVSERCVSRYNDMVAR